MSIYFVYALGFFSSVGIFAAQIVLSLYALKLGAGPFAIGVLGACFALFPMALAVPAGRVVDRIGPRRPMTLGAIVSGIGMLVPFFFPALPAVYVAAVLSGLAAICFNLATQNIVGLLSTPETRARYFSNYTLMNSLANFVGPLGGGFVIDHWGHGAACLFLSAITLAPLTMLAARGHLLPGGTPRGAKADGGGGGVRAMLADPIVLRTLITGGLLNSGLNLFQVYVPVYGHSIGLSASAIGIVLAMNSAAAFVVRFGLPQIIRKYGEARILATAFFAGAAALTLFPFFHQPALLALLAFGFGLGMGGGQPIVLMQMFSNSRDGRSGEALGLKFTANQLTKMVSPVVFGAVATAIGLSPMFWLNALLMACGGMMSRPSVNPIGRGRKP